MLEAGTKAPAFALPDQDGNVHTLEEYRGRKFILYFIRGIIRRAAQNRHAALANCIRSIWRRGRSCLA